MAFPSLAVVPEESPATIEAKRGIVREFEGPGAALVRGTVVRVLERTAGLALLGTREARDRGVALDGSVESTISAARALELSLTVSGFVSNPRKKVWRLELVFRNGRDGSVLEVLRFESYWIKGLRQKVAEGLRQKIDGVVQRAERPESAPEEKPRAAPPDSEQPGPEPPPPRLAQRPSEPPVVPEPPAREADKPSSGQAAATASAWELEVGTEYLIRQYGYAGAIRGALRQYQLRRAPFIFGEMRWYPGAHFTNGFASHLGLLGYYGRAIGIRSEVAGNDLETTNDAWKAGIRARLELGNAFELGLELAYGQHRFSVADTYVPDVNYHFVRPGIDGHLRFKRWLASAQAGYRIVLSTGELEDVEWFPNVASPNALGTERIGLDGRARIGYSPVDPLELLVGVNAIWYRFDLAPSSSDSNPNGVATTALDMYLSFGFSVCVKL